MSRKVELRVPYVVHMKPSKRDTKLQDVSSFMGYLIDRNNDKLFFKFMDGGMLVIVNICDIDAMFPSIEHLKRYYNEMG